MIAASVTQTLIFLLIALAAVMLIAVPILVAHRKRAAGASTLERETPVSN